MHINTLDHRQLFELWFAQPLRALRKLPNGQGGFIALATACFLYERYATAMLKKEGKKSDREGRLRQLEIDFAVDKATAAAFWDIIRDGVLHQGMPLQKKHGKPLPMWAFREDYPLMALEPVHGDSLLKVQPWKFMDKVLDLWKGNFDLLASSGSFPWATIVPVPTSP